MMKHFAFYVPVVIWGLILPACKQEVCNCSDDDELSDADIAIVSTPTKSFNVGTSSFKMIGVQGGSFIMGAQNEDSTASDYNPYVTAYDIPHKVTLSGFYMGETEVTEGLWISVLGTVQSAWSYYDVYGKDYPAFAITYSNVVDMFLPALNDTLRALGQLDDDWEFRLPTEAQWEYAARGGRKATGTYFAGSNKLGDVANASPGSSTLYYTYINYIKTRKPNELGLYDMTGNVAEWCADYYQRDFYSVSPEVDPVCTDSSATHVSRGGGYNSHLEYLNVSGRQGVNNVTSSSTICLGGFRLCLVHINKSSGE